LGAPALWPAYVLHSRRFGDTSLIVDLLTREHGWIACVAKGASAKARTGAVLQAFRPLLIQTRGRGDLQTLARVEPSAGGRHLVGRELFCGLYLNELLLRLTARDDPHPFLFDDYRVTLEALASAEPAEPVLRRFEVLLLDHLGLGLALEEDTAGQPIEAGNGYTYEIDSGPSLAAASEQNLVSGETLMALRSGQFPDQCILREARGLMRRVLDHHLGGRPLRSRELFRLACSHT